MKLLIAVFVFIYFGLCNFYVINEQVARTFRQTVICPGQDFRLGEKLGEKGCGWDSGNSNRASVAPVRPDRNHGNARRIAEVSAYTSRTQETDQSPEIAANGQNIWNLYQKGIKTCATNDYKFGTVLRVEGYGDCIVSDRMNRRYTGKGNVDLYFGYDLKAARSFGRKKLIIEVNPAKTIAEK